MNKRIEIGAVGLALVAILIGATPANAETMQVRYSAYELQSASGVQAVYSRIATKARRTCGGRRASSNVAIQRCRSELIDSVVSQLGSPQLAMLSTGQGEIQLASRAN